MFPVATARGKLQSGKLFAPKRPARANPFIQFMLKNIIRVSQMRRSPLLPKEMDEFYQKIQEKYRKMNASDKDFEQVKHAYSGRDWYELERAFKIGQGRFGYKYIGQDGTIGVASYDFVTSKNEWVDVDFWHEPEYYEDGAGKGQIEKENGKTENEMGVRAAIGDVLFFQYQDKKTFQRKRGAVVVTRFEKGDAI